MTAAVIADQLHPRRTSIAALNERDLQMFARIGVPPDLLEEAHIERVSDRDARERFGIQGPVSKNMAGIVFPYYSHVTGQRVTARVRRDNPEIEDGKPKSKYMSAYGDGRHLYFPPDALSKLKDPSTPIVLVEAEKSVLTPTLRPAQLPDPLTSRHADVPCHPFMIGLVFTLYLAHTLSEPKGTA